MGLAGVEALESQYLLLVLELSTTVVHSASGWIVMFA